MSMGDGGRMDDGTLAELQRLSDEATPAPWHVEESEWDIPGSTEVDRIVCGPNPRGVPREGIADVFDGHWVRGEEDPGPAPNLCFIVAARDAVPALIDALRAARRELGDTRARLAEQTDRADHNAAAVNANADMIVDLRARLAAALGATDQAGDGG